MIRDTRDLDWRKDVAQCEGGGKEGMHKLD